MRTIAELDAAIAAVDEQIRTVSDEARGLFVAAGLNIDVPGWSVGALEHLNAGQRQALERYRAGLNRLYDERAAAMSERTDARHAEIARLARDPRNTEMGGEDLTPPKKGTRIVPNLTSSPADHQRAAMAAIDRFASSQPAAADRLDRVVRSEPLPVHARYLAAVGDPVYASAWSQVIASPDRATLELDPAERAALREARFASQAMHLVALGTDDYDPGWPLPLQVDPSLIITGPGAEDPLRRLATVRTIVGRRLTVVTGDSVAAAYGAEGTDVVEVLPDPQPVEIKAERGAAFVRLTFELLGDLANATGEIAKIFNDAKTLLEAEKFAVGSGVNEPQGLFTDLVPFGGSPANPTDLRAAQSDLGPRYQANARWVCNLDEINLISTFVASADPVEPQIFDAAGNLLRKPVAEVSFAPVDETIYGDIRAGFTIVDRLGVSIEPTGPTFNKDTGVPSGHRGFLLVWRSGSKTVDPQALRLLADGS